MNEQMLFNVISTVICLYHGEREKKTKKNNTSPWEQFPNTIENHRKRQNRYSQNYQSTDIHGLVMMGA
jgi:hypothetical protein